MYDVESRKKIIEKNINKNIILLFFAVLAHTGRHKFFYF